MMLSDTLSETSDILLQTDASDRPIRLGAIYRYGLCSHEVWYLI